MHFNAPKMKMEEFKMCSDGVFMPVSLPCPPPYSGPYYYYPYENIPFPPAGGSTNGGGGGAPISAGAVAGIIIIVGFIIVMMCLFAIKFRKRLFRGSIVTHNIMEHQGGTAAGEVNASFNAGDLLLTVAGGGLEEKLVNLLPVFEYVRFDDDHGKKLLMEKDTSSGACECAVCLSLFEEKDIVRILPKCKHVFHLLCIDKWFESHANCPLCRERITLQTIQLFFKDSEDHVINVDDDQHQQLEGFNNSSANHNNHSANVNENCNQQHYPESHHYQNHSIDQQEAGLFAACAPLDHQIGMLPSAAAHNDDHIHAKKVYQSELAHKQKNGHHVENEEDHYNYQSFVFSTDHGTQSDMLCTIGHAAGQKAPRLRRSMESAEVDILTNYPKTSSQSVCKSCVDECPATKNDHNSVEGSPVSTPHHSNRPFHCCLKRSISTGSLSGLTLHSYHESTYICRDFL